MKKIIFNENNILKQVTSGLESKIYLYKDGSDTVILKELKTIMETRNHIEIITPEETFKNKEKKIQILHDMDILKDEVKLLKLVYNDEGLFIGYTMEINFCPTLFDYYSSKKSNKILLLEKLKEKVQRLNENGIYIGDYNSSNFGVKNNEIVLYDLDNYYVQGNPFDITGDIIDTYLANTKSIDNIDIYAFNLFTMAFVLNRTNPSVISLLKEKGLPRIFKTEENKEILKEILNIDDNFKKRYFLDYRRK